MDNIHRLLWGETVEGLTLQMFLIKRKPNPHEMSELLINMAKAFSEAEVVKARKDIDEFLLKQAIEYFGGMT